MKNRMGMGRRLAALLGLCFATLATSRADPALPADYMLVNGRIYTVDASRPWAEALGVHQGHIVCLGTNAEVRAESPAKARVIDLEGALVTPGLIDAHVHFVDGSLYLVHVALRDATTMAEVTKRVVDYIKREPSIDWVQGEGFSYGYPDLPNGEFHREILDAVSGKHPVLLSSGMAHAAWANSAALRRAGITRDTPNPEGGEIVRGEDGNPSGWLKEDAAINLVLSKIPRPTQPELKRASLTGIHEANRLGLTRVDSAGGDFDALETLRQIEREGKLTLRMSVADWINPPGLSLEHLEALKRARSRYRGEFLSCCTAKFIMDGVIESHTAYLPGGYADTPSVTGMRFFVPEEYKRSVALLNAQGFQVYTHAIGDGAIKLALDAYEESQRALEGQPSPRNRIEHGEAPDPEDVARFGRLGVVASMQPLMIYPRDEWKGMEGLWQKYAGDSFVPRAFALRSLLDTHAVLAFGTDWPVVQLNPLLGIRNAVLRQSLDGQPAAGYVPAQRISIEEAVRAYTQGSAYGSRADLEEGSLAVGKRADLVVYSRNFIESPTAEIAATRVVLTMVAGRVVFDERH